jgi:cation/acetate symporter
MKKFSWVPAILLAGIPTIALAAGAIDGGSKQATNWSAIGMFVGFVLLTLAITYWAAKRTASAADFYSAGGGITGFQKALPSLATTCRRRLSLAFRALSILPVMTA